VRRVRILEEASQEAIEAAAWYEYEEAGDTGAKRLILERFPYDIVAIELPDETVVIAVAHHSRKPGYWLGWSGP